MSETIAAIHFLKPVDMPVGSPGLFLLASSIPDCVIALEGQKLYVLWWTTPALAQFEAVSKSTPGAEPRYRVYNWSQVAYTDPEPGPLPGFLAKAAGVKQ